MNFLSLTGIELQKIRRSKILLILLAPVVIMWLPAIINSEKIQDVQGIPITPEHNFFIQGFMGMVWFMIPATLIICTVLLIQIEQTNHGMKKMLTLPINRGMLCLAKFAVLLLLPAVQMVMSAAADYGSAFLSSKLQGYDYILPPGYIFPCIGKFYLAALPAAAVFWMIALLIQTPVFAVGTGLALCVPSVLIINTDYWFLHPMSYPFYMLMTEYGKAAKGLYTTDIDWFPWLPVAVMITVVSLAVSCVKMSRYEE